MVTRDDILALEGRELDAALAEAFGWQWWAGEAWPPSHPSASVYRRGIWETQPDIAGVHKAQGDEPLFIGWDSDLPAWSSTWDGVGMIVAEMGKRGYLFSLYSPTEEEPGSWLAVFDGPTNADTLGETAARAVARAALLALQEEE